MIVRKRSPMLLNMRGPDIKSEFVVLGFIRECLTVIGSSRPSNNPFRFQICLGSRPVEAAVKEILRLVRYRTDDCRRARHGNHHGIERRWGFGLFCFRASAFSREISTNPKCVIQKSKKERSGSQMNSTLRRTDTLICSKWPFEYLEASCLDFIWRGIRFVLEYPFDLFL